MSLLTRKLRRDARSRWAQLAAVGGTLALGVAVFGAAFDAYDDLRSSYSETYDRLDFADLTVTGADTDRLAAALADVDGVAAVTTRSQGEVPFRVPAADGERTLLGRVVGQPPDPAVNRLLVEEGREPATAARGAVTVERHMADNFGLAVGDSVEVFGPGGWEPLEITGIAVSPEYLWPARDRQDLLSSPDDFGVLFAPPALTERLAGGAAQHQVLVRYAAGVDRPAVEQEVRAAAEDAGAGDVMPRREQPSHAALQQDVEAFGQLAVLFPALFLVAGSLAAYVLLGRLVRSHRSQLGMLSANGYPRRRILRHYLAFGAIVGAGGAAVGALGGVILARWLTDAYTSSLGIPLAVTRFHPVTPLIGLAAGTVAGLVAAAGPALAAVRVPPAEAMGGVAPVGVAQRGLVEHLPGLRALPVRFRMVVRNGARSPRRTASTVVGVVLASVLVLSSLGMLDTVELVLDEQFHHIQREDAQLYVESGGGAGAALDAASATGGVAEVEESVQVPVVLTAGAERQQTALQGFEPGTSMHAFPDGLPASGLVLGSGLRGVLDVEAGDTVQVVVGGSDPARVEVAGFVDEPIGSQAYASLEQARALAAGAGTTSVLARYDPGADEDALREELAGLPGVVAVRDLRGTEEAVERLLELFYAIVGAMLLFGSVLAFVVLVNTLSVNLAERTVELATLRAAGARSATLARLVTTENTLLVVAATPLGLVAGWATAGWLLGSFDSDLWNFSLRLRTFTPVLVAVALAAIALLSHVPARRAIRGIDVARIVRDRAV